MPNPATVRERRLRKTKAQLIDEIDTLEQRAADCDDYVTKPIDEELLLEKIEGFF